MFLLFEVRLVFNFSKIRKLSFSVARPLFIKGSFYVVALYSFLVSLLWGATNPLIKKYTKGIIKVQAQNPITRFIYEVKYLVENWNYVVLFLINQLGSVLYFVLLQSADLSLIVPTVNALTFIITIFVGLLVGESIPSLRIFLGVILILTGISFCVFDKIGQIVSEG